MSGYTNTRFINIFFAIVFFILYIIIYNDIEKNFVTNLETYIYVLSCCGVVLYIFSIYSWYKVTNKIIDLYTIIFTFLVIFNYGRCLLWAFDIHVSGELGTASLFNLGVPTNREIVLTQLLTLISMLLFNVGAIFCYKNKKKKKEEETVKVEKNTILRISQIMAVVVIPVTFIQLLNSLMIRLQYGYSALYYGEFSTGGLIYELISRMFFICLFGLLVGSDFSKNTRKFVYLIFLIYVMISIYCGDRGGWIYALCIFAYLHHSYVKKFTIKSIIIICIVGILSINIINAFVKLRNTDVNMQEIAELLYTDKNPIISVISEMGGSMSIQTTLIMKGYDIYPYGNTYIFSILGIISDKFIRLLGIDYIDLSTWFSQHYLKLDGWGAGFSIVAEALLNFGPYIAPLIMSILGWGIGSLVYLSKEDLKNNPKKIMFALIACSSLVYIARGTMSYNLKVYFYRLVVFFLLYMIIFTIYNKINKNAKERAT